VPAYEHDPFPSGGGTHRGNIADVVFMLLFGFAVLSPVAYFMNLYFLSISLFYMVIYVWSKRHPAERTTFYMFQVPALYLPWVMVAFSFIVGGNPILDLVGIGAGHLYYFVQQELPNLDTPLKNSKLLHTPMFLYNLFGVEPTYASAANVRLQERVAGGAPRPTGGHAWGTGRRLVD
jgi:Derlin-2/3